MLHESEIAKNLYIMYFYINLIFVVLCIYLNELTNWNLDMEFLEFQESE